MDYLVVSLLIAFLLGILAIACNPSPYYGSLSLVLAAGACSCVLAFLGATFLSLVLFLIYLGGMAVVFAFTVALASEPFPAAWGERGVTLRGVAFIFACILTLALMYLFGFVEAGLTSNNEESKQLFVSRKDTKGMSFLYSLGGDLLLFTTCALLLTLFVVMELARGIYRVALRVVSMCKKQNVKR